MIRALQDTFTINLTQGKQALVDERDWHRLREHKWHAQWCSRRKAFCVKRMARLPGGKQTAVLMHREILGLERGDKRVVDHINWNPLDNRRTNLRIVTNRENSSHRRRPSRYGTGVRKLYTGRFQAHAAVNRRQVDLGTYDTPEEALAARAAFLKAHELE